MLVPIGMVFTLVFGYTIAYYFVGKKNLPTLLGLSYVLGIGLLTLIMFLYSLLGIKITSLNTFIILFVLLIPSIYIVKPRLFSISDLKPIGMKLFEKVIVMSLLFLIILSLLVSLYWPVYIWDALALYDFVGLVIADMGSFVNIAGSFSYFTNYPLMTSLAHTWVYILGGENPQFLYSLFYISFILIFYGSLRKYVSRTIVLTATILMATTPVIVHHSTFAYTNLSYTTYFVSSTIFLFNFLSTGDRKHLILSGLLLGLSTWTRYTEPFWITNFVVLFIYTVPFKNLVDIVIYTVSFLPIRQPWAIVLSRIKDVKHVTPAGQVADNMSVFLSNINIERFLEISYFLYQNVVRSWFPSIIVFVLALFFGLINYKKKSCSLKFLSMVLINAFVLWAGTYIFSIRYDYWDQIAGSAVRMSMFFIPLMLFYSALVVEEKKMY